MIDYEWLETCVNAGEFLYGYFTAETLKSMYERKEGCRASVPELTDAVESLEEEGKIFVGITLIIQKIFKSRLILNIIYKFESKK